MTHDMLRVVSGSDDSHDSHASLLYAVACLLITLLAITAHNVDI